LQLINGPAVEPVEPIVVHDIIIEYRNPLGERKKERKRFGSNGLRTSILLVLLKAAALPVVVDLVAKMVFLHIDVP
jgi:hypothetical protein